MNAVLTDADIAACRLDILAHAGGTADKDVIDARRRHQRTQQHANLSAIQSAVQDRDVLLLARDDMEDREPLHEAIFQVFQRFAEQHAASRAVAIEQEEPALRLPRQHTLGDRQDRRNAGACGEADIDPRLVWRVRDAEAAGWRHHVEFVAGLQFVGGPA